MVLAVLLLVPSVVWAGRQVADGGPRLSADLPVQHVVEPGETLTAIARQYGLTLEALMARGGNQARFPEPNSIRPGQKVDLK